jgi:hypothetical protein
MTSQHPGVVRSPPTSRPVRSTGTIGGDSQQQRRTGNEHGGREGIDRRFVAAVRKAVEPCLASPHIVDGTRFLRSRRQRGPACDPLAGVGRQTRSRPGGVVPLRRTALREHCRAHRRRRHRARRSRGHHDAGRQNNPPTGRRRTGVRSVRACPLVACARHDHGVRQFPGQHGRDRAGSAAAFAVTSLVSGHCLGDRIISTDDPSAEHRPVRPAHRFPPAGRRQPPTRPHHGRSHPRPAGCGCPAVDRRTPPQPCGDRSRCLVRAFRRTGSRPGASRQVSAGRPIGSNRRPLTAAITVSGQRIGDRRALRPLLRQRSSPAREGQFDTTGASFFYWAERVITVTLSALAG